MCWLRLDSSTKVSGQRIFIKSSFRTTRSLCCTRTKRVSKALGERAMGSSSRIKTRSSRSMRKEPNCSKCLACLFIAAPKNYSELIKPFLRTFKLLFEQDAYALRQDPENKPKRDSKCTTKMAGRRANGRPVWP